MVGRRIETVSNVEYPLIVDKEAGESGGIPECMYHTPAEIKSTMINPSNVNGA